MVRKREAGIWQWRFHGHHLRSDEAVRPAMRYVYMNPVKHGFAAAERATALRLPR